MPSEHVYCFITSVWCYRAMIAPGSWVVFLIQSFACNKPSQLFQKSVCIWLLVTSKCSQDFYFVEVPEKRTFTCKQWTSATYWGWECELWHGATCVCPLARPSTGLGGRGAGAHTNTWSVKPTHAWLNCRKEMIAAAHVCSVSCVARNWCWAWSPAPNSTP